MKKSYTRKEIVEALQASYQHAKDTKSEPSIFYFMGYLGLGVPLKTIRGEE